MSEAKKRSISVKQAAELMGKSEQFIRVGLQRGLLPFGTAMMLPDSTHYTYYISPKQFYDYVGRGDEEEEVDEDE